jgi:hypothetical protein
MPFYISRTWVFSNGDICRSFPGHKKQPHHLQAFDESKEDIHPFLSRPKKKKPWI